MNMNIYREMSRTNGIVLRSGDQFIITTRKVLKMRGIKVRLMKTNEQTETQYVMIDNIEKPVWEFDNWDMCSLIDDLFEEVGKDCWYNLADFLITSVVDCGRLTGVRI